ncbi:MAG: EAL domain-containing protein [Lachnospiraceae bacterium]|nr:EAL domain-containing protein [Lachnospiraceae bacterium]
MEYNYSYELAALIVFVFCGFLLITEKGTKRRQNRILLLAFTNCVLSTCCSLMTAMLGNYADGAYDSFFIISEYIYHAIHVTLPFLFVLYVYEILSKWNMIDLKRGALMVAPLLVFYSILILNMFVPVAFVARHGIYERRLGIYFEYIVAVMYMVWCIVEILMNHRLLTASKKVGFCSFLIICLLGVLIQLFYPTVLIEAFMEALGLLALVFSVEDDRSAKDVVTGARNRNAFINDNQCYMAAVNNYHVVYVKFANFRNFQTAMGVLSINEVLLDIATWLLDEHQDYEVYYLENGVFALCDYTWNEEKIDALSKNLEEKFSKYWTYGSITIPFNTQIYTVKIPKDVNNINELLSLIDSDNNITDQVVARFEGDDLQFVKRKSEVEAAIKRALDDNKLKVYYQPIWDSSTNKIRSAEALVRLIDDDLGFIPPDEFIPIAEQTGQILDIGTFVFETVCQNIKEQNFRDLGIDFVDVNLSPVQCMQSNLDETFRLIMDKYGIDSDQINLEITETAAAENPEMFKETMEKLKAMGFKFSLDDYGTGFANISYMVDMEFHIIKIDKTILWNADKSETARVILDNTIRMIKEMGVNIITEGVETQSQRDYLRNAGCDYCQGYYFSRPVERDSFVDYCIKFKSQTNG